jgi:hypothetical protein
VEGTFCVARNPFVVFPDVQDDGVIGNIVDGYGIEVAHGESLRGRSKVSFKPSAYTRLKGLRPGTLRF